MHPKETKITPLQLAILLIPGIGSTAVLGLPAMTAFFARQDAWLAPLLALPGSCLVIWLCGRLAVRFPEQTFAEYAPKALGTVPGKLCGLLLFWYFFQIVSVVSREFADFLVATAHPRTPLVLVVGLGGFAAAVAARHGPTILARLGELFTPLAIVLVLIIIGMASSSMDTNLLKPALENGWRPVLTSAFVAQTFFGQMVLLAVLLPSVARADRGVTAGYAAAAFIAAGLTAVTVVTISVFGPLTDRFIWPFYKVARIASFGEVLVRIDPLVVAFWVPGTCLKLALHLYAAVLTFARTLGLKHWQPLVFPMSALASAYAVGYLDSLVEHLHMLAYFWPPYLQLFQVVLPALVLFVAALRRVGVNPDDGR